MNERITFISIFDDINMKKTEYYIKQINGECINFLAHQKEKENLKNYGRFKFATFIDDLLG